MYALGSCVPLTMYYSETELTRDSTSMNSKLFKPVLCHSRNTGSLGLMLLLFYLSTYKVKRGASNKMWDIIKYGRSEIGRGGGELLLLCIKRDPSIFYDCVCNNNGLESFIWNE